MKNRCGCKVDSTHPISEWDGRYDSFVCLVCHTWTEPPCDCNIQECEFSAANRPENPTDAGYTPGKGRDTF
jgi:hypothetical protein